jgi:pimeloyl-ACP methyl ester carboxylesterase
MNPTIPVIEPFPSLQPRQALARSWVGDAGRLLCVGLLLLPAFLPQAGSAEPKPAAAAATSKALRSPHGAAARTNSPVVCAAPTDRAVLVQALLAGYGRGPSEADRVAPEMKVTKEEDQGDHVRRTVSYNVEAGERVTAYLLIPKPLPQPGQRLPLVLCPHPTNLAGKDCVTGHYETPPADEKERLKRLRRQYALDLVRRGFVCFAPDRAAYGARAPLPAGQGYLKQMQAYSAKLSQRWPGWHLTTGKAVWDLQRALDFLLQLDFVDPQRTAIIGHSLGAWDAMLLGAVDERVKVVVANAGGTVVFDPAVWTDASARNQLIEHADSAGISRLANLMLMAMSPRPFLNLRAINDPGEKGTPNLLEGYRLVVNYYQQAGAKENPPVAIYFHATNHDFRPDAQELAYTWLAMQLGVHQEQKLPLPSTK